LSVGQPDAELRGLVKLGAVVEALSSQALDCGLRQDPLESAVAKSLSDAGLQVQRHSDEDTYVYVNIMTSRVTPGLCVSRYDVFLYSYTTAELSFAKGPRLLQVELIRKGGMTGGAPAEHPEAVLRGVKGYVDEIASRIRAANR